MRNNIHTYEVVYCSYRLVIERNFFEIIGYVSKNAMCKKVKCGAPKLSQLFTFLLNKYLYIYMILHSITE